MKLITGACVVPMQGLYYALPAGTLFHAVFLGYGALSKQ